MHPPHSNSDAAKSGVDRKKNITFYYYNGRYCFKFLLLENEATVAAKVPK